MPVAGGKVCDRNQILQVEKMRNTGRTVWLNEKHRANGVNDEKGYAPGQGGMLRYKPNQPGVWDEDDEETSV